jgi:hypothetical protein
MLSLSWPRPSRTARVHIRPATRDQVLDGRPVERPATRDERPRTAREMGLTGHISHTLNIFIIIQYYDYLWKNSERPGPCSLAPCSVASPFWCISSQSITGGKISLGA